MSFFFQLQHGAKQGCGDDLIEIWYGKIQSRMQVRFGISLVSLSLSLYIYIYTVYVYIYILKYSKPTSVYLLGALHKYNIIYYTCKKSSAEIAGSCKACLWVASYANPAPLAHIGFGEKSESRFRMVAELVPGRPGTSRWVSPLPAGNTA